MRCTVILIIFLSLWSLNSWGQTEPNKGKKKKDPFERQRESFEENAERQADKFSKNERKQAEKYRQFKQKVDQAFGDYLRQNTWKKINSQRAENNNKIPKPVQTPVADVPQSPQQLNPLRAEPLEQPVLNPTQVRPSIVKVKVPPKEPQENLLEVRFFEQSCLLPPSLLDFKIPLSRPITENAIADYWQSLSQQDYAYLVQQILPLRSQMQLNDWGYYLLLKAIAEEAYDNRDCPESRLMTWFLLLQSGFKARIGYLDKEIYLLLPSQTIIYRNTYYKFDETYYYVIDAPYKGIMLNIYQKDYPDAPNVMRLDFYRPLKMDNVSKESNRQISFKHEGKPYVFDIAYDANSVAFYANYPLSDIRVFFTAPPSEIAASSLKATLEPLLKDMSEYNAVNFLLSFVQKGFDYKTDDQQFGYEKTFFIEELFYYPYSDCEDRSVLFAYLIKELLGLEVVALDYPGHIATAVKFSQEVAGDYVMYEGEKFVVCDPTFVGAAAGRAMSRYRDQEAKVVGLW